MTALVDVPAPRAAHGRGRMVDTVGPPVDLYLADAAGTWELLDLCPVLSVDLHTGRSDPSTPVCEPATLVVSLFDPTGQVGTAETLRRGLAVMVSAAAVSYWHLPWAPCLFLGTVADVAVQSDPRLGTVVTLTAGSHLADLGRTYVGDTPWPQERATVRASRVLGMVDYGVSLFAGYFDPNVLARDVDRQPALDIVGALAVEALFGVVDYLGHILTWATLTPTQTWAGMPASVIWSSVNTWAPPLPPGTGGPAAPPGRPEALLVSSSWRKATADARSAGGPGTTDLVMSACELLANWSAGYSLAGMTNRLALRYGPTPDGGEQPETVYVDQHSIDTYGLLEASLTTDLATKADADAMAANVFDTAAVAKPSLPSLTFDLWHSATLATGTAFLTQGGRPLIAWWQIPDLPDLLPVNGYGFLWLEGTHQSISANGWLVEVTVSDPWGYGNAWQWQQLAPAMTWATTPPALTWDNVNAWEG